MIQITETIHLSADKFQFILQEKKIRKGGEKEGEEYYEVLGYHPSADSVIKALNDRALMEYILNDEFLSCMKIMDSIKKKQQKINDFKKTT